MTEETKIEKLLVDGSPSTVEEEQWIDYFRDERFRRPERLEDAAKSLSALVGTAISIISAVIGATQPNSVSVFVKLSLGAALLSIIAAFFTLFPRGYQTRSDSAELIYKAFQKAVRFKSCLLKLSIGLFLLSLLFLFFWILSMG